MLLRLSKKWCISDGSDPFDIDASHIIHDFFIFLSMIDRENVLYSRVNMGFNSLPTIATPNLARSETFDKEIMHAYVELGNICNNKNMQFS